MLDPKTKSQSLTTINLARAAGASAATKWFSGEDHGLASLLGWRSHYLDTFERGIEDQSEARTMLQAWGRGFDTQIEKHVEAFAASDRVADVEPTGCDPRANDICDGIQTCLELVGFNLENQVDATDTRRPIVSNGEAAKLLRFSIASANMLAARLGADRRA